MLGRINPSLTESNQTLRGARDSSPPTTAAAEKLWFFAGLVLQLRGEYHSIVDFGEAQRAAD